MKRTVFIFTLLCAVFLSSCAPPAADSPTGQTSPSPFGTASAQPTAVHSGVAVWTDDSQLEPRPQPQRDIYQRWYGKFTDHLIPSKDYGPLIPFSGTPLPDPWNGEYGGFALMGLMTLNGKVVVDPVYGSVTRLGWGGNWDRGTLDNYYNAILLSRYAGDGEGDLFGGDSDVLSVLCAGDGSWVTEQEYRFDYEALCYGYVPENGALFGLRDGNVLVMLDMNTGKETFAVRLEGLFEEEISYVLTYAEYGDGRVTACIPMYDNGHFTSYRSYCWDNDGNEISLPGDVRELSGGFSDGLCPAKQSTSGLWGYLDVNGQWAIPPQFDRVGSFEDGVARVNLANGFSGTSFIDKTGAPLHSGIQTYDHVTRSGDYWYFTGYSGDAGLVLDKYGNEIESPALHGGAVEAMDYGWAVMDNDDGSQLLIRGTESWPIPAMWDDLWSRNVTAGAIYLTYSGEYAPGDSRPRWLMWRPEDGDIPHLYDPRVKIGSFDGIRIDPITGERYLLMWNDDGTYAALTPDGEVLFDSLKGWPSLYGGCCLTSESGENRHTVTLRSQKGSVLFRRTWEANFD